MAEQSRVVTGVNRGHVVRIERVPRRTRWLPRWAWHVATAEQGGRVRRVSGYARTWRGAALRVGRLVRSEATP